MAFGYTTAAAQFLARARNQGRTTVPLGSLLVAHAMDALDPGQLSINAYQISYGGKDLVGVDQLAPVLSVPGVRLQTPAIATGDVGEAGLVSTSSPDSIVLEDFHYTDLTMQLGVQNTEYIDKLKSLWNDHVGPLGILTDYQLGRVLLLLNAGIIVIPASHVWLMNLHYPSGLQSVAPKYQVSWDKIVAAFKPAADAYANGNYALAAAEAESAARTVAIWDGVIASLHAINELPTTLATGAVRTAGFAIGAFGFKNWLIVGGVIGAIFLVRALPGIAASRMAKS